MTTVCLVANTLRYPEGGHLWVYLNWALGLRGLGCRVLWLEIVHALSDAQLGPRLDALKEQLARYGLGEALAACAWNGESLPSGIASACQDFEAAAQADLVLNMLYAAPAELVGHFRRTVLLDIDPGLLQVWMAQRLIPVARHDAYFTIGETVGRPGSKIPDVGLHWQYTPPCIALEQWPFQEIDGRGPFTTVSHWYSKEWVKGEEGWYNNEKREGFLPFLDLPRHTREALEVALSLGNDERERAALMQRGWRVKEAWDVVATPWDYQRYIQHSRGEFGCAKPSCIRLQNAWISDRTLCYLASGKPAVVQHTGPSRFLPDAEGLFRFRTIEEARRSLEAIADDYERQCRLARALAEEHFDARKVIARLLERAL